MPRVQSKKGTRLKAPRGQAPVEDLKPHRGPTIARVGDPAAAAYEVYGKALEWKGPGGKGKMKLWHELSVHDRRAYRLMYEQMRLQISGGNMVPVPTPGEGQFSVAIGSHAAFTFKVVERDDMKSITDLRKLLHEMDIRVAEIEEEINPGFRERLTTMKERLDAAHG